jgi:hypothetical protein
MRVTSSQGDKILGGLSVISGIVIIGLSKLQDLKLVQDDKMGPGFFPVICGIFIALCGIMLLIEQRNKKDGAAEEKNIANINELKNLLLFVIIGVLTIVLTPYIGLLPSLGLCVIAYLKIQGRETWLKSITIGVCMTIFLYLLFAVFCMCRFLLA